MNRTRYSVCVVLAVALLAGCTGGGSNAGPTSGAGEGPVTGVDSLIAHMRQAGFRAERADQISQPFLTPLGTVIRVNDEEMQVYRYADETVAAREAARVGSNGRTVGTSQVGWIAPPHFFRKRNLLVIYLGSNEQALLTLSGLLGPQFAGS